MPYSGGKLSVAIPEDVTIWSWLFESAHSSTKGAALPKIGGFRDALNSQFLSFDDVQKLATQLSTALAKRYGIGQGVGICIFASNSIWYPVALFAAVRLGAVVTCSSPEYSVDETHYILKSSVAKVIFADQVSLKAVQAAASSLGVNDENIILIDSLAESTVRPSLHQLIREARLPGRGEEIRPFELARGQSNKDLCAYLSFTSGTTSRPKGVMISHHNVIAQILQMQSLSREDTPTILLGVLPLFHITGLVQILQLPIVLDQEVVIMPKFDMKAMMEVIVKYKCDELWLVPPLLIRLVNDPVAAGYDLPLVKQFNTGAAPLAQEIIVKLAERFPHVAIRQAWGMTESTSALTLTPPNAQTYANAHTVGAVVPETVLKIVDTETGNEVMEGHSGEIWAKGPQVTMGYKSNPKATAETFDSEGYLHTGDIGSMLPGGLLVIQDRLKEMIKVKGVGVAPAELEDLLLGHPLVLDVAVIGVPDAYAGELPKAFIVLDPKAKPDQGTSQALQDFVRKKKSRSKWLGGGVEFLDQIPKSASGKILRRFLRDSEKTRLQRENNKPRL